MNTFAEPFDDSKLYESILSTEKSKNADESPKRPGLLNLRQYDYTIAYDDYAIGYKEAADQLIDGIGAGQSNDAYLAYPVMFLYRHYMELRLKEIVIGLKEQVSLSADFDRYNLRPQLPAYRDYQVRGHRLTFFWNRMLAYWFRAIEAGLVNGIALEELEAKYDIIGKRIKELDKIDRSSEVFRYPVDKEGNPYQIRALNSRELRHVKDVVEGIAYHLDTISGLVYEAKEELMELYEDAVDSYWQDRHADYLIGEWKDARY